MKLFYTLSTIVLFISCSSTQLQTIKNSAQTPKTETQQTVETEDFTAHFLYQEFPQHLEFRVTKQFTQMNGDSDNKAINELTPNNNQNGVELFSSPNPSALVKNISLTESAYPFSKQEREWFLIQLKTEDNQEFWIHQKDVLRIFTSDWKQNTHITQLKVFSTDDLRLANLQSYQGRAYDKDPKSKYSLTSPLVKFGFLFPKEVARNFDNETNCGVYSAIPLLITLKPDLYAHFFAHTKHFRELEDLSDHYAYDRSTFARFGKNLPQDLKAKLPITLVNSIETEGFDSIQTMKEFRQSFGMTMISYQDFLTKLLKKFQLDQYEVKVHQTNDYPNFVSSLVHNLKEKIPTITAVKQGLSYHYISLSSGTDHGFYSNFQENNAFYDFKNKYAEPLFDLATLNFGPFTSAVRLPGRFIWFTIEKKQPTK